MRSNPALRGRPGPLISRVDHGRTDFCPAPVPFLFPPFERGPANRGRDDRHEARAAGGSKTPERIAHIFDDGWFTGTSRDKQLLEGNVHWVFYMYYHAIGRTTYVHSLLPEEHGL